MLPSTHILVFRCYWILLSTRLRQFETPIEHTILWPADGFVHSCLRPFLFVAAPVFAHFAMWPFRLWPSWFVAVLVCDLFGLWPFRIVAVPDCGRFCLWPFRFWPSRFVAVMSRNRCFYKVYDMASDGLAAQKARTSAACYRTNVSWTFQAYHHKW